MRWFSLIKKKRLMLFIVVLCVSFIMLIARIAYIQLINPENYSSHHINLIEESVKQRTQKFQLDYGRGRFLDRSNQPLSHHKYPVLILFPFLKGLEWPSKQVADIVGVKEKELVHALSNNAKPFAYGKKFPLRLTEQQMKLINELHFPGVYAQHKYFSITGQLGQPLIGVTGEDEAEVFRHYRDKLERGIISPSTEIGKTGLQKAFDPFLMTEGEAKLLYHVDGKGGPLFGLHVKYIAPANPFYPISIVTTLDKDIQQYAESVIDKHHIKKGGLVLLDVETSDLLALVSRPINMNDPFDHGKNQMITVQIPGSIFKIVTAAAAIETQAIKPGRMFNCDQNIRNDGYAKRRLGMLNFEESFEQSCNNTFSIIAKEMSKRDPNILEEVAEKLGLTSRVSWRGDVFHLENFTHLPTSEEEIGRVWFNDEHKLDGNLIAQSAIGQQDVRVTPLSVANMMATIARGGLKKEVRTALKIVYKNGTTLTSFPNQKMEGESITPYTASKLKHMLTQVVKSNKGTGHMLSQLPYTVAGKSGTAQIGSNTNRNHHWFAGYFPVKTPKYVLVVVNLDQQADNKIFQVYMDLVNYLYENDR
jgi:penicillin-binding protein 4B